MDAADPVLSLDPIPSVEPAAEAASVRQGASNTDDRFPGGPDRGAADAFEPPFHLPGFEILEEISRGGMGIVYHARQLSLDRPVALKRLPPAHAGDPERLKRFYTEAVAAARLQDFGILPVYDVLQVADTPVLVMPLIDGPDLDGVIAERAALRRGQKVPDPCSLATADERTYVERLLPILDRLIDAVAATHAAAILHRDIKPSNVLLDAKDNAWLIDFGLAQVCGNSRITRPGEWMGTPGFISPEQWDGREDLDARADLFSLAATIYQALTLRLPYGTRRLTTDAALPAPPRRLQPLLSADLDAVLLKALEPNRDDRYASVAEFRADWQCVRQGLHPQARRVGPVRRLLRTARRSPWKVASCILAVALLGVLGFLPRPPVPQTVDKTVYRTVKVTTQPPGARVVLVPFNQYGEPDPAKRIKPAGGQKTPLTIEHVPVGRYLVVAEVPGYGFHEVYRTVPEPGEDKHSRSTITKDGTVELVCIHIVTNAEVQKSMAYFAGGELILNDEFSRDKRTFTCRVPPYYLDTTEVTVGAFKKVGGWLPPEVKAPPNRPPDFEDYAVHSVSYGTAADCAESMGKRLPTQFEYEFAATKGGTQRFPWGDDERAVAPWVLGPVKNPDYDRTDTDPPVYGLYSNLAEWTDSMNWSYDPAFHPSVYKYRPAYLGTMAESRVIRGAPSFVIWNRPSQKGDERTVRLGPRWHEGVTRERRFATVGFRCARSAAPRFLD